MGADVGAGRDHLVDPVEDVVGEDDAHPRERVVQVLRGANAEQRARHRRVRDREGHREVGRRVGGVDQVDPGIERPGVILSESSGLGLPT
ncbi:hypothetical protein [Saccharothrix coeruleofusca]|uniref:hypothetical protein n=1 Tax=Saccharothrix coeruleofusca TaxID=33919 RepID=UPI0016700CB6